MNIKTTINYAARTSKPAIINSIKKHACIVLGTSLLFAAGTTKANELKNDTFQKEKTELLSDKTKKDSGDKTLVGESILGGCLLTYMGLCLLGNRNKKNNT